VPTVKRFISARAAIVATACISALAAAACANSAPRADLSGTGWAVESVAGQPMSGATIEFAQDRISGTGGCNRFFGGYTAEDGRLSFSAIGATRMACETDVMDREERFFAALNAVQSYSRDGDRLTLTGGDGQAIVLRAQ
jgi:heat shock protein HslJ